jgi:hypothetical protein
MPIDNGVDTRDALASATNTEVEKIDNAEALGLRGTVNSVAYRVHGIECATLCWERWMEKASAPNGEIHVADRGGAGAGDFQIDAGNDDWGPWLQILGSSDTPVDTGQVRYGLDWIGVSSAERNSIYYAQFAFGTSGATALANGAYTETKYIPDSNLVDSAPVHIQHPPVAAGTKAWARCICPGQNTATLDFSFSLREWEG